MEVLGRKLVTKLKIKDVFHLVEKEIMTNNSNLTSHLEPPR